MSEKNQPLIIVQGDVLFLRLSKGYYGEKKDAHDAIVALGEVTGHRHVAEDVIYVEERNNLAQELFMKAGQILEVERQDIVAALFVPEKGKVRHLDAEGNPTGEHADLDLPQGSYVVAKQRRFDPNETATTGQVGWSSVFD
jgi:hypothetical protein